MRLGLSKEEKLTVKSYNLGAKSWAAAYANKGYWQEEMKEFKDFLATGKILEIGCGGGRDVKPLLDLGYEYVGIDVAKKFVDYCKEKFPKGNFLWRSIYDLNFPKDTFDGFWASAVFLHVPKKKIKSALINLKQVIKNGGIGFISVKQGDGEKIVEDKSEGDGKIYKRFWSYYNLGEFADVLVESGFEILKTKVRKQSERTTWLIYFVKS